MILFLIHGTFVIKIKRFKYLLPFLSRASKTTVYGADVILFEGILAFYDKRLIDLMDLKIFVDADSDTRLARRCK